MNQTNQVHTFGINSSFGVQAWNSYSNPFPRALQMIVGGEVFLSVSNEFGQIASPLGGVLSNRFNIWASTNIPAGAWRGFADNFSRTSFLIPFLTNAMFLTNAEYVQAATGGGRFNKSSPIRWDSPNTFRVPQLWLTIRSRLRFALVDTAANRIVDCANLDATEAPLNLMSILSSNSTVSIRNDTVDPFRFLEDQPHPECDRRADRRRPGANLFLGNRWRQQERMAPVFRKPFPRATKRRSSASGFREARPSRRATRSSRPLSRPSAVSTTTSNGRRTIRWCITPCPRPHGPPCPVRAVWNGMTAPMPAPVAVMQSPKPAQQALPAVEWQPAQSERDDRAHAVQHPGEGPAAAQLRRTGIFRPTNCPNVGWLGRVHRGTPWQSLYLKSANVPVNTWARWSGNTNLSDAVQSRPVRDRDLFDLFTTAPNENATRGQLSINQTGLAAWSAVLSGVSVLLNDSGVISATNIEPAAVSPELEFIVQGINATRAAANQNATPVYPNGQFQSLGDILAVPELTENSPFLNTNGLPDKFADGISDAVLERIPQQTLSLLTLSHSPRFVIYSYGQTLRPAERSIVTAGGRFFGLCTNYQVTAETATRAVVRVDGGFVRSATNYPPKVVIEQFNVLPPD